MSNNVFFRQAGNTVARLQFFHPGYLIGEHMFSLKLQLFISTRLKIKFIWEVNMKLAEYDIRNSLVMYLLCQNSYVIHM